MFSPTHGISHDFMNKNAEKVITKCKVLHVHSKCMAPGLALHLHESGLDLLARVFGITKEHVRVFLEESGIFLVGQRESAARMKQICLVSC